MTDLQQGSGASMGGMGLAESEVVRLTIPAALEFVRIARLTASGVASRLGFDIDEVEDLRVAIDELSSVLVEAASGRDLDLVFTSRSDGIEMEGRVAYSAGSSLPIEDLTRQILAAVVDEYSVEVLEGAATFRAVKRLTS
jgi:serine/threonine-protein kinase RsbW